MLKTLKRPRRHAAPEAGAAPKESSGPTVLIVDDDPDLLRLAVLTFRQHMPRATVVTARDGQQGAQKLVEIKPQVMVCDLRLPGPSGFDLCREVRTDARLRGKVKVLAITGQHSPENRAKALREGADDYLMKPFEPGELLKSVRGLLPDSEEPLASDETAEDETAGDPGVHELGEGAEDEEPSPQEREEEEGL